jgi:hypothetical protein
MPMTDAELLIQVESLVEDFRWARSDPGVPEHKSWQALKQVATDIRQRQAIAISDTHKALERRIVSVDRAKERNGGVRAREDAVKGLGEELWSRWPAVRHALERSVTEKVG